MPEELRASDGRVPGQRGLATRQRLLDATADLLATTSYRELKVIDIAREASTSPATFYQYFPDVESAILVLAEGMAGETAGLAAFVRDSPWTGKAALDTASALTDRFLEFWEAHRSLLRVTELASAEGDRRFAQIRARQLNEVTNALRDAVVRAQGDTDVDPLATAGVLVAMLTQVAAHRYGFEFWGIRTGDVRRSMAAVIHWSVTGKRLPG